MLQVKREIIKIGTMNIKVMDKKFLYGSQKIDSVDLPITKNYTAT